jgi:hypothetical protein
MLLFDVLCSSEGSAVTVNVFTVYPDEVTKGIVGRRKEERQDDGGKKGEKRNVTIFVDAFTRADM